jgi:FkbM family methyltransferase
MERLGARALDRHEHDLSNARDALQRERANLDDNQQQLTAANLQLLALRTGIRQGRLGAVSESELRELERLAALPNGEAGTTDLLGFELHFLDGPVCLATYVPIFLQEIYRFVPRRPEPRILDVGANIGLATLFWKRMLPTANIVAFEPDAAARDVLQQNLDHAGITDVDVVPAAVWTSTTTLELAHPALDVGHVGSRIVELESADSAAGAVRVPAVRLRDYLADPVDLLKLDIEGAEVDVVLDCGDQLGHVEHLFVEYHGFTGKASRLVELLATIEEAGFSVFVEQEHAPSPRPFIERADNGGMDIQLNLFCYRT